MKPSQRSKKWQKFLRRLAWPQLLSLLAAAQIIVLLLLATTWPRPTINLSFIVPGESSSLWKKQIERIEAQNPGLRISIIQDNYSTDDVEAIYSADLKNPTPRYDLIYLDSIWLPKFAQRGMLQDLSQKISTDQLKQFSQEDLANNQYQGKLYRIPIFPDVGMLYYRKDWLQEAGYEHPPQTFEQLQQIAQTLQQSGKAKWGFLWQGDRYEGLAAVFVEVLEGYGGFWIDPKTLEVGLDRPEALKAAAFLQNTIEQNISPPEVTSYKEEETLQQFQQGNSVFLRHWSYAWSELNAEDSLLKGKIGLTPVVNAPNHSSYGCRGGWGMAIASTSKHPALAWQVIQFLSSEDSQRQMVLEFGYLPAYQTISFDAEVVKKYPSFPELIRSLDKAVLRPPIPEYDRASDILQIHLSEALRGTSVELAMNAAARETRALLSSQSALDTSTPDTVTLDTDR